MDMNKVIMTGHLGADPEVRRLNNGSPVVNFRLAVSESWRDKASGEKREKTEWVSVVVFNEGLCKVIEQYLSKGDQVLIEGKFQTRKWVDKNDAERYSTEVVLPAFGGQLIMLKTKGDKQAGRNDRSDDFGRGAKSKPAQRSLGEDLDDEIPF